MAATLTEQASNYQGIKTVEDNGDGTGAIHVLVDDGVIPPSSTKTDDAAFTPATDRVAMLGAFADETAPDSVDEGDAGALRMTLDRRLHIEHASLTNLGAGEYETVAASQTAQVIGLTGAAGDYIVGILVIPATTSPGQVLLLDGATSITVFVGGASSVSDLVPFFIPLGMKCTGAAWKITTGANVSVIASGNFT